MYEQVHTSVVTRSRSCVSLVCIALVVVGLRLPAQQGAQNGSADAHSAMAVVPANRADSTLVFDWSVLPSFKDPAEGRLNQATITVRYRTGAAAASLPLRLVIGPSAGSYGDGRIENAVVHTDSAGRATFIATRITGEPRVVYLAVQSVADGQTSSATVLLLGGSDVASVVLEQRPNASANNGGLVGEPRVRVLSRDGSGVADVAVVAVRSGGAASLSGEIARTDDEGVATFPKLRATADCHLAGCGSVSLQFRAGNAGSQSVSIALAIPPVSELVFVSNRPADVISGEPIPPVTIVALSADKVAVPGAPILVRSDDGQSLGTGTTDAAGASTFASLRLSTQAGANRLNFLSGSAASSMPVTVRPGRAGRIEILGQPPTRIAFDSVLSSLPMVKVTDGAGNPVAGVPIHVSLCARTLPRLNRSNGTAQATRTALARWECEDLYQFGASIGGTTMKETGIDGRIIFDDLRARARTSELKLVFTVLGGSKGSDASSNPFVHDPESDYDNNLVGISALKTISGVAPESEFFDLRFRFRIPFKMHVMSNVDLALTSRQDSANASAPRQRLTEASLLLNVGQRFTKRVESDVPERLVAVGGQVKVFGTVPYWGVHAVALEMGGSPFQGSSLSMSLLRRWSADSAVVLGDETLQLARHNVGIDFFVRSATVDFFKVITIRGSILVPFDKKVKLTSRIALAVPVGSVVRF